MLELLYTEAIKKKDVIVQSIESYQKHDLEVFKYWIKEKIAKSDENFTIAAGDGSKHDLKFLGFYFYAIAVESLIYENKLNKLTKIENSDLDIIPNTRFAKDRIRNYMGLFEIKSALKTVKSYDIDYYLYDGSILGDLIRPFPLENDIPPKVKREILNLTEDKINEEIAKLEVEVSSRRIAKMYLKDKFKKLKNFNPEIYLENVEKLLSLYHLLKNKEKIIAISKTSTANDYFNANIPDIAIFDRYDKKQGYSKPREKEVSKEVKHEFPVEDEFFRNLTFTIFYLRLEDNKNILKVELPYKANEEDIKKIIEAIAKDSVEGYPYLLKKAHHDVVIGKKDIDQLAKIVGFYEKSGREMLM